MVVLLEDYDLVYVGDIPEVLFHAGVLLEELVVERLEQVRVHPFGLLGIEKVEKVLSLDQFQAVFGSQFDESAGLDQVLRHVVDLGGTVVDDLFLSHSVLQVEIVLDSVRVRFVEFQSVELDRVVFIPYFVFIGFLPIIVLLSQASHQHIRVRNRDQHKSLVKKLIRDVPKGVISDFLVLKEIMQAKLAGNKIKFLLDIL